MSVLTSFLKLFKYQSSDDASTFNLDVSLNDNWDKVDAAVSELDTGKADTNHTHTAADVGADPVGTAAALAQQIQGNLQTHQSDETKHVSTASKATPVDADSIALVDSADGNKIKRVLWSKVKSLFAAATHYHSASDVTSGIFPLSRGGLNANTAAGGRATLDTMKPVWAEVTLPATGWTLSGTVYVQTVACAVAATTMKLPPNVGLQKSTDTAAAALEKEAFALIETVDTADGSITATCGDTAPQVAITLLFSGGVA